MARLLTVLFACLSVAAGFVATPLPSSQLQQSRVSSLQDLTMTAATKPQRVNERNRIYNKQYRSEMRTRVKRVRARRIDPCPPPASVRTTTRGMAAHRSSVAPRCAGGGVA